MVSFDGVICGTVLVFSKYYVLQACRGLYLSGWFFGITVQRSVACYPFPPWIFCCAVVQDVIFLISICGLYWVLRYVIFGVVTHNWLGCLKNIWSVLPAFLFLRVLSVRSSGSFVLILFCVFVCSSDDRVFCFFSIFELVSLISLHFLDFSEYWSWGFLGLWSTFPQIEVWETIYTIMTYY